MSKISEILELKPDHGCTRGGRDEELLSKGHTCPECHGNGWHYTVGEKDRWREACSICNGTGMVDAVVTIHWQASKGKSKV